MPEVHIKIGGRAFEVSCQEGEQAFLEKAAGLLDDEAQVLTEQLGRMPEARLLLMSGLMLADKTAGIQDAYSEVKEKLASQQALIEELHARPTAERVEVPVIPAALTDGLAELAARAEALADEFEEGVARD